MSRLVGHVHVFQHLLRLFDDIPVCFEPIAMAFIWNDPSRLAKQGIIMFSITRQIAKDLGRLEHAAEMPIWLIS